ncbi:MAG: TonB-dependent receptor [Opitutales bacterium]|nr:TonB-dependent receptor [Opitutales bacterium]
MHFLSTLQTPFARRSFAVALLGGSTLAPGLWAQEDDEIYELSPFIVDVSGDRGYTATASLAGGRLATALRDTAASVTVMTEAFIRDVGATNFIEAARWAPNAVPQTEVRGQDLYNDYQVSFRSLGGRYQTRNFFRWYINSDGFSTDRIDFSRGPNGLVFGDSGSGGIANINSKRAHRDNFGEVLLQWSSFGGFRVTADANYEVSETVQVRVAGVLQRFDDWRDVGKNDREGLFATVTIRPNERSTIRLEGEWGDMHRLITFGMLDNFSQWDGVTTNPGFIPPGEVPPTLQRQGQTQLVFNAGRPDLGLVDFQGFANTAGNFRQLLPEAQPGLPASAVIPSHKESLQAPSAGVYNDYITVSAFWEHRITDNLFLEVAANYQKQTRDARRWFFDAWTIDVNETLPGGQPNPYLGEAYGQARLWTDQQTNEVIDYRASLAYLLESDLTDHRFLVSAGQRKDRFSIDWYEWVRTNGPNPQLVGNNEQSLPANRIFVRRYASDRSLDVALPPSFDPVSGIEAREAHTRAFVSEKPVAYVQTAAVGQWLPSRALHTMLGARRDFYRERTNRGLEERAPVTREIISTGSTTTVDKQNVTSLNGSAVYHFTRSFSAFAGYSESFDAGNVAIGIDGRGLPSLESKGIEGGFKLFLFDERVSGTVTYYRNEEENNRIGGEAANINRIWSALEQDNLQVDNYQDRVSFRGTGWELDFTANPTPNWRLLFNIAFPETKQTGGFADTRAYVAANRAAWESQIAELEASEDLSDRLRGDLARNSLQAIDGRIGGFAEGRRIDETFRYTANIFSRYFFRDGPLDGFSIGGGANIRGARTVGNRPGDPFDYVFASGYTLFTLVAGYERELGSGLLSLQLNVSNLFDKEIVRPYRFGNYVLDGQTFFVPDRFNVQDPRRFLVTASYRF